MIEATHIGPMPEDVIAKGHAALVSRSRFATASSNVATNGSKRLWACPARSAGPARSKAAIAALEMTKKLLALASARSSGPCMQAPAT